MKVEKTLSYYVSYVLAWSVLIMYGAFLGGVGFWIGLRFVERLLP